MSVSTPSTSQSRALFTEALDLIPGGVNSPVRAFRSVGGDPRFMARAEGPHMWDVDGNRYLDMIGSWGPMILGHGHPAVKEAVAATLETGMTFGTPSPGEVRIARLIRDRMPSIEKVRMVNSGTEATMSALRLARAATGREKIVKFTGCYHGHADLLLVQAGSGVATLGLPDSPGVTPGTVANTLTAPFNDFEAISALFELHGPQIAGVIVEPVVGNAGTLLPKPGYLEHLRELTRVHGALLIFDEVMTGFRVARGGAQERLGIQPDLTCLGKIIGGGLPVGAYGGRADLMNHVAPAGTMYQAGTLSGNPMATAAGSATLEALGADGVYEHLENWTERACQGIEAIARDLPFPVTINRCGAMFTIFFHAGPVTSWEESRESDTKRFARFFHGLLERGIYWPPSQFEAAFPSLSHGEAELDLLLEACREVLTHLD